MRQGLSRPVLLLAAVSVRPKTMVCFQRLVVLAAVGGAPAVLQQSEVNDHLPATYNHRMRAALAALVCLLPVAEMEAEREVSRRLRQVRVMAA